MVGLSTYFPSGFTNELKHITRLSVPIVITQLLQMTFGLMSLVFCGRLGPIPLACAALSTSLINVTGVSVVMGLSAACDTLYAQTYGSTNRKKLGVLVQRGVLILLLCLMPCFALHVNIERILVAMGQNIIVANLSGEYMLIAIPGIAAFSVYMTVTKYMQCQGIVIPSMVIGVIANIVCGVLHYVLIFVLDMGTNGSAWSITAGYCTLMVLTIAYVVISGCCKETWDGFDLELFREWGQFLKLAYSGMFMLGFEWWSFEVGIFLAGMLGTIDLDAQSIILQIETLAYMLPFGIGFASSVRIGQYLGQGSADGAKTATRVALVCIVLTGIIVSVLIGSLRWVLPKIFSDDEDVIALAGDVLPVLAFYMVFNCINGVGCGVLRGMGRQLLGSGIIFVVYFIALVTGVPTLLLSPLGIKGYWWCMVAATLLLAMVLSGMLLNTNWTNEVNTAQERISIVLQVTLKLRLVHLGVMKAWCQ
jgi:MATE family multidrug resistance protein